MELNHNESVNCIYLFKRWNDNFRFSFYSKIVTGKNALFQQQKISLESKVVKEVKKFLNPYYQSKSITRDDYKQIVAKCVKKVQYFFFPFFFHENLLIDENLHYKLSLRQQ